MVRIIIAAMFAVMLLVTGCARFPDTPSVSGKQIVFTIKVAGRIRPVDPDNPSVRKYYFIAIDNDGDSSTGPWAVIGPPFGGNGWVTSSQADKSIGVTSYVEYDSDNPSAGVYSILPGSFFLNTAPPQLPVRYEIIDGGSTIRLTLDFSQIATATFPVDKINQLNINFITTSQLAVNPSFTYPLREWDALGPTGQDYLTFDAAAGRVVSGDDDGGDVTDPDLDIIHWSIEVQTVSSG